MQQQHPYEEPFLLALLVAALFALVWLFGQFIPALLFALLLATSSYSLYTRLQQQFKLSVTTAAFIMTTAIFLLVILPVSYLLAESGRMGAELITHIQNWLAQQSPDSLAMLEQRVIGSLPLSQTIQENIQINLHEQLPALAEKIKQASLWIASNLFSGLTGFIGFMAIALFSLFFFYRDGKGFITRIVNLSPLTNHLDHFILRRFTSLSTVLTLSVLGVALLQGMTFAFMMFILNMPWLFLGLAYAVASFVPIVGGFLIWGPVAIYFLTLNEPVTALIIAIYSSLIIGIGIDNILRPIVIQRLASLHQPHDAGNNALDHTWLTLLSTFAGLLHFGIMGLLFGPMLAAMAITIFDVYEHKHRHQLDYS